MTATNAERWENGADTNDADYDDKTGMTPNNFALSILRGAEIAADFLAHYVPKEASSKIDWLRLTAEPTVFADRIGVISRIGFFRKAAS